MLVRSFAVVVATAFVVVVTRRFAPALRANRADRPLARFRRTLWAARVPLVVASVFAVLSALRPTSLVALDAFELVLLVALPVWVLRTPRAAPGHPSRAVPKLAIALGLLILADLATAPAPGTFGRAAVQRLVTVVAPSDAGWIPRAAFALHVVGLGVFALMIAAGAFGDPLGLALRLFLRDAPSSRTLDVPPEHAARTAEYRAEFARKGHVVVRDFLPPDVARALAAELPHTDLRLEVNSPVAQTYPGAPACSGYLAILTPHAGCDDPSCAVLCRFGSSLLEGPLRDWLREITAIPTLHNRADRTQRPVLAVQAHPKGGYIAPHTDHSAHDGERVALAMIWHAALRWDPSYGGELRLYRKSADVDDSARNARALVGYELDETLTPRFNDLHVFAVGEHQVHEVTLVTADAVRWTVAGRLYEPVL